MITCFTTGARASNMYEIRCAEECIVLHKLSKTIPRFMRLYTGNTKNDGTGEYEKGLHHDVLCTCLSNLDNPEYCDQLEPFIKGCAKDDSITWDITFKIHPCPLLCPFAALIDYLRVIPDCRGRSNKDTNLNQDLHLFRSIHPSSKCLTLGTLGNYKIYYK